MIAKYRVFATDVKTNKRFICFHYFGTAKFAIKQAKRTAKFFKRDIKRVSVVKISKGM